MKKLLRTILFSIALMLTWMATSLILILGWEKYYSNGAIKLDFFSLACFPATMGIVLWIIIMTNFLEKNDRH